MFLCLRVYTNHLESKTTKYFFKPIVLKENSVSLDELMIIKWNTLVYSVQCYSMYTWVYSGRIFLVFLEDSLKLISGNWRSLENPKSRFEIKKKNNTINILFSIKRTKIQSFLVTIFFYKLFNVQQTLNLTKSPMSLAYYIHGTEKKTK
jgi:hypothetical protein